MKKTFGFTIIFLMAIGISVTFAQWGAKDVYDAIPDAEYYVTVYLKNGTSLRPQTVSSCTEALDLKDRLLYTNAAQIAYIKITSKYVTVHGSCDGKTFYP